MGCHFLLQGIFLTQGLNLSVLRLLHWRQFLTTSTTPEAQVSLRTRVCGFLSLAVGEGQSSPGCAPPCPPSAWPGLSLLAARARPWHQGPVRAGGAKWGAFLGTVRALFSSPTSPGAPVHCKESHAFPLEIRIEPACAPGQSPASSAGPPRPGKGSQMVLA